MKLDLGCGKNPKEGFIGVDAIDFGQEIVCDLRMDWKWEDESVDEVHCSHLVEHLTASERIHFVNELFRVLKTGAKAAIVAPHWASTRAYGDLTHQWPPVCEMWFCYLSKDWRAVNAPHNDAYKCDFDAQWGYSLHGALANRNFEYQQHALAFWKEAAQDIVATLTKRTAAVAGVPVSAGQTGA